MAESTIHSQQRAPAQMPEIGSTHSCQFQTVALIAPSRLCRMQRAAGCKLTPSLHQRPWQEGPKSGSLQGISLPLGSSPASFPWLKKPSWPWSTALSPLPRTMSGIDQTLSKYLLIEGVNGLTPAYLSSSISCFLLPILFSEFLLVPKIQHALFFPTFVHPASSAGNPLLHLFLVDSIPPLGFSSGAPSSKKPSLSALLLDPPALMAAYLAHSFS